MFLKNRNIIFKMKKSKVTDYAALNRACLKGPPYSALKHLYTCQYKPKGMELGGQFACSREGAGQETIVSFGKGESQA